MLFFPTFLLPYSSPTSNLHAVSLLTLFLPMTAHDAVVWLAHCSRCGEFEAATWGLHRASRSGRSTSVCSCQNVPICRDSFVHLNLTQQGLKAYCFLLTGHFGQIDLPAPPDARNKTRSVWNNNVNASKWQMQQPHRLYCVYFMSVLFPWS